MFSEKLILYLKKYQPDNNLISLLADAGLDTKEALKLITMERPYRGISTLIKNHYHTYTTQKFNVIDKIFLPYRLIDLTNNAQRRAKRKNLKKSIDKLVERRHQIAHSGDYNAHNKIRSIDERAIGKRIKCLELLVKNMDKIICNRIP